MTRLVVLLRGINLAGRNRIAMADLRDALGDAGFDDVGTYLQSGNVVLSSDRSPGHVAEECERLIEDRFGLDIKVIVRTRDELAEVVARSPLEPVADDPKRYHVTFLAGQPDPDAIGELAAKAVPPEQLVHLGSEIYTWHPNGFGRSKLAAGLTGQSLGVTATVRNWTTVTALLARAGE